MSQSKPINPLMPQVFSHLTSDELIEHALTNKEGILAANGSLNVLTGLRTGRSPKDKYIVKDDLTTTTVDWGGINQPMEQQVFAKLWQEAEESLKQHPIYEADLSVGSDPNYQIDVNIRCNLAWHTLFCKIMFLPRGEGGKEQWTLINAAHFQPDPEIFGLNGPAAIVLDFSQRRILICGTLYGGEMKKALFTVMNYQLPAVSVLPMHCSATTDEADRTTLFFGLSGTGKTTLSADPTRLLIGDDEHGWGDHGVFNFEGGCYAKCIHLSQENEPLIWEALRPGSMMENVVVDPQTGIPDFDDAQLTENTRAAYPLSNIEKRVTKPFSAHPLNVVFLTCDLFGVLPPVARLSLEQARFYFLVGYTALVGSTEFGSHESIRPTFSRCFGAPFFPRPATEYADLLVDKIQKRQTPVYLVNTGWHSGPYGKGGKRFSLPVTRRIIQAINQGELDDCLWQTIPHLDLSVPLEIKGVDSTFFVPENTWTDPTQYQEAAKHLKQLLEQTYQDLIHHKDVRFSGAG